MSSQLVKYEVLKSLKGNYMNKFIVVDHIIFSLDQLSRLSVGDVVVLHLKERSTLDTLAWEPDIREENERVGKYYIQTSK